MSDNRTLKRKWLWRSAIVLLLVIGLISIRLVEEIGEEKTSQDRFRVIKVLDGDTVELTGGDRLRLLAIDTPEKGEELHDRATEYLSSLVLGQSIQIKFATQRRDKYGRLLGFAYLDTLLVNSAMLEKGLANLYLFSDNDLKNPIISQMLTAQREAMKNERGIWALEYEPEYYYISIVGSFRFHRPACRSIDRSSPENHIRYEIREQAMALGLSPCRNCKP